MNFPFLGTTTRNPGDDPLAFPLSITHDSSGAPSGSSWLDALHAPRANSSIVIGRTPIRLVNQAESATSSRLFTLAASGDASKANDSASGRKRMLSAPSQMTGDT